MLLQRENNLSARAASFVKGEVKDVEDALKGARDIIAEQVNEDERARNAVRNQFSRQAKKRPPNTGTISIFPNL